MTTRASRPYGGKSTCQTELTGGRWDFRIDRVRASSKASPGMLPFLIAVVSDGAEWVTRTD